MQVLRGGRNWSLAGVAAREEPTTRQMTAVGLQDADVYVLGPRVRAVALDEVEELHEEALVPRERRFAAALVPKLLQISPCEVAYWTIWPEIPGIDVESRDEAVFGIWLSRPSCNPHSARCLHWVQRVCQACARALYRGTFFPSVDRFQSTSWRTRASDTSSALAISTCS